MAIGLAALGGLIAAGRFLLNPLFRLLSLANAREVMTGAALLVVLGAALLMKIGGLSMALGSFLAGVLLSRSTFRHQLEADIEPFRALLLGLFFLGVGMALDVSVVIQRLADRGAGRAGVHGHQGAGRLHRRPADRVRATRTPCTGARC